MQIRPHQGPEEFVVGAVAQFQVHQFVHDHLTTEGCGLGQQIAAQAQASAGGNAGPFAFHGAHMNFPEPIFHADPPGPGAGFGNEQVPGDLILERYRVGVRMRCFLHCATFRSRVSTASAQDTTSSTPASINAL